MGNRVSLIFVLLTLVFFVQNLVLSRRWGRGKAVSLALETAPSQGYQDVSYVNRLHNIRLAEIKPEVLPVLPFVVKSRLIKQSLPLKTSYSRRC